jgi:hypothetical protein
VGIGVTHYPAREGEVSLLHCVHTAVSPKGIHGGQGVKLTSHFHLVTTLRVREAIRDYAIRKLWRGALNEDNFTF